LTFLLSVFDTVAFFVLVVVAILASVLLWLILIM